ncbi:MAG: YccF domain-containing protein [Bacteroidales bacterium]|jgi:uncharacterized membrane protein YccF (DUF307 family)|nr:YccF domain-containing protein [Bacteroidales bacterium]
MRFLGNIIWLVFGGIIISLEYLVSSILLIITIIGIPFGLQTLKIASVALWPFGKKIITVESHTGCLSTVMNVFWIFAGGIWICVSHLILGLLFCITIVGIPFGNQHFKLAGLSLSPFGKDVVEK